MGDTCQWTQTGTDTRSGAVPPLIVIGVGTDVNGDGRADIVWHNETTGAVVIWFLNANGTRSSSGFPGGAPPSVWELSDVADVNGDGRADIVWHNGTTGAVVIWFLNANGTRSSSGFPGGAPSPWELN